MGLQLVPGPGRAGLLSEEMSSPPSSPAVPQGLEAVGAAGVTGRRSRVFPLSLQHPSRGVNDSQPCQGIRAEPKSCRYPLPSQAQTPEPLSAGSSLPLHPLPRLTPHRQPQGPAKLARRCLPPAGMRRSLRPPAGADPCPGRRHGRQQDGLSTSEEFPSLHLLPQLLGCDFCWWRDSDLVSGLR